MEEMQGVPLRPWTVKRRAKKRRYQKEQMKNSSEKRYVSAVQNEYLNISNRRLLRDFRTADQIQIWLIRPSRIIEIEV